MWKFEWQAQIGIVIRERMTEFSREHSRAENSKEERRVTIIWKEQQFSSRLGKTTYTEYYLNSLPKVSGLFFDMFWKEERGNENFRYVLKKKREKEEMKSIVQVSGLFLQMQFGGGWKGDEKGF